MAGSTSSRMNLDRSHDGKAADVPETREGREERPEAREETQTVGGETLVGGTIAAGRRTDKGISILF